MGRAGARVLILSVENNPGTSNERIHLNNLYLVNPISNMSSFCKSILLTGVLQLTPHRALSNSTKTSVKYVETASPLSSFMLKTDKTENFSDKTKVDGSENSEKKLKDISNTDKKTYR